MLFKFILEPVGRLASHYRYRTDRSKLTALMDRGLKIGTNVYIMEDVEIDENYPFLIEIGDNCRISKGVNIMAHDSAMIQNSGATRIGRIRILEESFIGERVTILPGVTIGPRALVAAGSVVSRDLREGAVSAGSPARPYGTYTDLLQRYAGIVRSSTIVQSSDIESGAVSAADLRKTLEEEQVAFISGVPQEDPYYIHADYPKIMADSIKAYEELGLPGSPVTAATLCEKENGRTAQDAERVIGTAGAGDKIKILFLVDELLIGGTEKQLVQVAEGLPTDRFEPVIGLFKEDLERRRVTTDIPTVLFKFNGPYGLKNARLAWQIKNYIEREKIDILQTHFVDSDLHGTLATLLSRHKPVLFSTRRDLYHWVGEEPVRYHILRQSVRFADRVLVNSHRVKEELIRRERVTADKVELIQNAVNLQLFEKLPDVAEAKRLLGLEDDSPLVGIVANWRPVKGLITFITAAKIVHDAFPTSRFVLIGYGPQKMELQSLARELGIADRVTFLGNSTDIPKAVAAFDIAVQASLSESFSNVLVEYMAAGRPVVATSVGDADRVIDDGQDGLLVPPNDPQELGEKICFLCRNREAAESMGRLAREKVKANWSSETIIAKYRELYEEAAFDRRRRS